MTPEGAATKIVHNPNFEWMRGMWFQIDDGRQGVVVDICEGAVTTTLASYTRAEWDRTSKVLVPNAASLGCLQELVRKVWNKPVSFCQGHIDEDMEEVEDWVIVSTEDEDFIVTEFSGDSEIEVLLRALEGVPSC